MLRAATLSLLLLTSCFSNSNGQVNLAASSGIWGGVLIVGGAGVAAGRCQPNPEECDHVERGDPVLATALVISGVALLGLAYLFDRTP